MRQKWKWAGFLLLCFCLIFGRIPAEAASMNKSAMKIRVTQKGVNVSIFWKKRANATGYKVYRYDEKGKRISTVSTKSLSYQFENQKMNRTYSYSVCAYQKSGKKTILSAESKKEVRTTPTVTTKSTLKKLLKTGLKPVGSTMYVWGGGWNKSDKGAGEEAVTIGVSPKWKKFFDKQTSSYDYNKTRYQIHNGLDCSGYIGWCIYNIMNTQSGKKGYVMLAKNMAKKYASYGWGTYTSRKKVTDHRAGDIMSCSAHVYMVVGECSDGSIVLLHSSPPGVMLTGTATKKGKTNSQAVKLAKKYMKKYYPKWYKKFPDSSRGVSYLTDYNRMRWDLSGTKIMSDPDGYSNMSAEAILKDLFK